MSELSFAVGQRWVSNSEAELGLGIITEVTGRRIEIAFPAADEQRSYAANNAPLSRVDYPLGEQIKTRQGQLFTISEKHPLNGCVIYQGETAEGEAISIHEMDLDSFVQFSQATDRLFAGQIDKNRQFQLRLRTHQYFHRLHQSPVFGLLGARVQCLPHQFYIASQMANRISTRVLLADEVGLGKTIEAGLIMHQQIMQGRASRVLVIVPSALVHQWLVEMLRRFNLAFTVIDAERYEALVELDEGNAFESAQLVLTDLQTLESHPEMQQDLLQASWDMLVVDEAHHLQWHAEQSSDGYQLVEKLAAQIASVLLLTATPEQLGMESHFARLRLLDPDRYYDLAEFREEQQHYQHISQLLDQLMALESASEFAKHKPLQAELQTYLDEALLAALADDEAFETACEQAKQQFLDQFGTGRILFRNTRDTVKGFPERQLTTYPLEATKHYLFQTGNNLTELLQPEILLGENWLDLDPRVDWLVNWLKEHRGEKTLLITANAETAQQLELHLRLQHGVRSSVFHEHMTLINRDRAAAFFADDEEGAQILICSEIGSEGRNFQFCSYLVLFDLPLNPDLLEQRIGRLDRIGQRNTVNIVLPFYQNTAQHLLLDWYHLGLNAFESVCKTGSALREQFAEQLEQCLRDPADRNAFAELLKQTQQAEQQLRQELSKGRDRLLTLNSYNEIAAKDILMQVDEASSPLELAAFMDDFFDAYGVEQQAHSADSIILHRGDELRSDEIDLPEDGLTATYQRTRALSREDMAFLSWEHPLVMSAMDAVISSDLGNTAFCQLKSNLVPAGSLLLEVAFVMHCPAPKQLNINRFIPESYMRIVLDEKGRQLQEQLTEQEMNQLAGRIPKHTAQQMVQVARERIDNLIERSKQLAGKQQKQFIEQALHKMSELTDHELLRLQQLAEKNTHIKPAEIEALRSQQQQLKQYLQNAELKLDALRLIIVTEAS
ncbi:RNA polymerase-associated protein RapA [Methylophaga pinxianii]|uniref:RNA polymerase-associated protein RapA n=1 Tax=Methylophaga pinxianii TaxID=2881052 RepID=UPI001CF56DCC|nr:RNA polymerase-associated protein RapA [Methylophaga pinxianii]MCB2427836.1 RNA polymerase-associated protein RapA [Methylophaga pinxianii]UPH44628.1 RNA polymerase-associated protein RapA [Methylophaga pinxianii]